MACGLVLGMIVPFAAAGAQPSAPQVQENSFEACTTSGTAREVRVDRVDENGDLVLAGGERARLAALDLGIGLITPERWQTHRAALNRLLAGKTIAVASRAPEDRWRRSPLLLAKEAAAAHEQALTASLLMQGLARFIPREAGADCTRALYRFEAKARSARLGLWQDPKLAILAARDRDTVLGNAGIFTLVEGRIVSVGERQQRRYLNFGRIWTKDMSATIQRRDFAAFDAAGLKPADLRGRYVRLRGIVRSGRAPWIALDSPVQIELLDKVVREEQGAASR
jgi:hypothetical protein